MSIHSGFSVIGEGEGEDVVTMEDDEDAEASDTDLVHTGNNTEEDSNLDADEEGNRVNENDERYRCDRGTQEESRKLVEDLQEVEGMKIDKDHSDLIVLDYLVKEGYLDAVESFLKEGIYEYLPQEMADYEMKGKKYLLKERSSIVEAIWCGDISRAIELTVGIDQKFFEKNPELHLQLRLQQFIELMRSSKISKIEAISFLKSHFSSYLLDSSSHNQYTRISFHVDNNTTTYDSCTAKEDNFVCKDDSKDLFTQEIQGFIETIMMYLVFPTAELSHTMHFSGMSLTTAPTTGCPHSKDQAHLDGKRIQLPNHLKKMLDLSRRTYLSDLLNQEIFKILGVNNNISSLLHILNDQFCLQEEISERLKIKVENTRRIFFSTCVGLT